MSGSQQALVMAAVPGIAPDPSFGDVVLLIQPMGADDSTTFVDQSSYAHSITVRNDAKQSTEQQINGLNSMQCDGNGDALRIATAAEFSFSNGTPFTLECFTRFNTVTSRQIYIGLNGSPIGYFDMHRNSNSRLCWAHQTINEFAEDLVVNTWYHLAVCCDGTDTKGFVNGVTRFTALGKDTGHSNGGDGVEIGAAPNIGGDSLGLNGYITQIRLTIGAARYTADFTPPAAPFATS